MHNSDGADSTPAEQRGLIAWFMHNRVAANILMFALIIGGIVSISMMRTETFPSIDPNMITITVPYPGATPYEVADSITSRVEEELIGIEGVKRIESTASEGAGLVRVELEDFSNADDVYNDVETAVNALSDFPPEDAERPVISKVKVTPNVLTLALYGDVEESVLKYWTELLDDEIRQLNGVALTATRGVRDYEISINVSEEALQKYNLSLQEIQQAIRSYSRDIPAGTLESVRGDISLRVQEKRYRGEGFGEIVVRTLPDGSTLRIRDVAQVSDGFADTNLISRFQGKQAAFIDIKRSENEDTLKVASIVKNYLDTLTLPTGLNLTIQQDDTVALKDRISLMIRNAILGFMLVFVILLLFLDLRLAFWTSAAIPISFFGGLMIMHFFGYSINMISLFALIVVLGVVVDDGIITGESIFDAHQSGGDASKATLRGVRAVIAPVTVGVTTTMAAFAPLIFSTGTLGQIISIIPVVVISILFISLIDAYFILPAHLSTPGNWSTGYLASMRNKVAHTLSHVTDNHVVPAAQRCIRWRYVTIAAFVSVAIITASMMSSGMIRFIFFPQIESDNVKVNITMPVGTPFAVTTETVLAVEEFAQDIRRNILDETGRDAFESISSTIGSIAGATAGPDAGTGGSSASNVGQINVQLVPSDYRSYSASDIEAMIRKNVNQLPGIETVEFQSSLVGEEADIEIELSHPDEATLNEASEQLKEALSRIDGTKEVTDSFIEGKREYVFSLTPEGLALGLTPADLGQQLRAAFFGLEAQRFQRGRSEVIVYVRYPEAARNSLDALRTTRLRLANGNEVPLSSVADIKTQTGYSQIKSVDGRRIVSVSGDVDASVTTPNAVMDVLRASVLPELKKRYPNINASFEGESRDQQEDLASLMQNMMIAMLLIYVLLGAQLQSYIQPFIIMCAIPFGVVGAIWGHVLLGYDVTFISLFGIVALSGVVVNDSVVLIDYFNIRNRSGDDVASAAVQAVQRRFRPILLTTLSTSLGLLPILLETSIQARFLIPMVVSLAMGIIFATVIILLLVPCLLMVVEDVRNAALRLKARL